MKNYFTRTDFPYFVLSVTGNNDDVLDLSTIKEWLRIDDADTDEDALLTRLRDGVIEFFEGYTSLVLLETEFKTTRDMFYNRSCFQLRKKPYLSLTSFEYYVGDVLTPVPVASYYEVINDSNDFSKLNLKWGSTFPTDIDRREQAIEIVFSAGLAGTPQGLDQEIINALLNHIASWYEKRGDCDTCTCADGLPPNAKQVYDKFKTINFGVPSNLECINCDLPFYGGYFG